jgi:hypothetical protein
LVDDGLRIIARAADMPVDTAILLVALAVILWALSNSD